MSISRFGKQIMNANKVYERFGTAGHENEEDFERFRNVCRNQNSFNHAFQKAVDNYTVPSPTKETKTAAGVLFLIWLIFLVWALILAIKKKTPTQNLNIIFAVIFPPLYVLGDIISEIKI